MEVLRETVLPLLEDDDIVDDDIDTDEDDEIEGDDEYTEESEDGETKRKETPGEDFEEPEQL